VLAQRVRAAAGARMSTSGPTRPCRPGDRVQVTIAAVGDVLMHDTLQIQAREHAAAGGFATAWRDVVPALRAADVTFANLEGPVAEGVRCDGRVTSAPPAITLANSRCGPGHEGAVYTQDPRFNYPPDLLDALAAGGVDVVATANNHALDRGAIGVDRTLDALEARGIAHAGTRRQPDAGPPGTGTAWRAAGHSSWSAEMVVRGAGGPMHMVWIACTAIRGDVPDTVAQVRPCFGRDGRASADLLEEVHARVADANIDAVIVTPHWGEEYAPGPGDAQRAFARAVVAAGALLVLGTGPHVVQAVERLDAGGQSGMVAWSLGNFVSDQHDVRSREGIVLYVGVVKGESGQVRISDVRYLPTYVARPPESGRYARTVRAIDPTGPLPPGAAAAWRVLAGVLPAALRIDVDRARSAARPECVAIPPGSR
jgi:hypothetical protein